MKKPPIRIPASKCGCDTPVPPDAAFPITTNALKLAWGRLKRRAGIVDLRFHDLRHEAITRFFEMGLTMPEVALISGHRDVRMLFRYTHLRVDELASKMQSMAKVPVMDAYSDKD